MEKHLVPRVRPSMEEIKAYRSNCEQLVNKIDCNGQGLPIELIALRTRPHSIEITRRYVRFGECLK